MWQRKQTLFLSLALGSLIAMLFFPVWHAAVDNSTVLKLYPLFLMRTTDGVLSTSTYLPYCWMAILGIAAATLCAFSISRYEARNVQLIVGTFNSMLTAATLGLGVYFATDFMKLFSVPGHFDLGLYFPIASMIFNFIANIYIRRDERLLRTTNRVR